MSGPIIRKYGFPNFEKIFGEREIQHGEPNNEPAGNHPEPPTNPEEGSPPGAGASKEEKESEDSAQL